MIYKMYLLHISESEDNEWQRTAMSLMDNHRKQLVEKYAKEKDRLRAIAAGLLLQVGFLELEPLGYKMTEREAVCYLQEHAQKQNTYIPVPICYEMGAHGKPSWNRETMEVELGKEFIQMKHLWHFNLSHSGDYVVLVVSDTEVGVDVQEERDMKHYSGGYKAFSRMEAYVKCTGEGYGKGHKTYEKYAGNVPGYEFLELEVAKGYVMWLCFKKT